jgi:excinuclease UvrABC nuclease subunit
MAKQYKGHHLYTENDIASNAPVSIGVYYCGAVLTNGILQPYYIGKSAGENGIWGRLMDHFRENKWYDVTHFGFMECDSEQEALNLEAAEIKRCQPKYNIQGK